MAIACPNDKNLQEKTVQDYIFHLISTAPQFLNTKRFISWSMYFHVHDRAEDNGFIDIDVDYDAEQGMIYSQTWFNQIISV